MLLVVTPANAGVLPLISTVNSTFDFQNGEIGWTGKSRYIDSTKGLVECEYSDGRKGIAWHMSFDNGYAPMCPSILYTYWGIHHAFVTQYSYNVFDNWKENTPEGRQYVYGRNMANDMQKNWHDYVYTLPGSSTQYIIDGGILHYMLNDMLVGKKPATMGDIQWNSKVFDPHDQTRLIKWEGESNKIIDFIVRGYV